MTYEHYDKACKPNNAEYRDSNPSNIDVSYH